MKVECGRACKCKGQSSLESKRTLVYWEHALCSIRRDWRWVHSIGEHLQKQNVVCSACEREPSSV